MGDNKAPRAGSKKLIFSHFWLIIRLDRMHIKSTICVNVVE